MNVFYYEQNAQQILAFKDPPFDILSDEYSVCCSFELLFFKVEVEIMISKFNRLQGWKQISFFFSFQLDFLNTALEKMKGWRSSLLNQWSWRDHQETKQMLEYFFHISLMWDSFLRALGRQPNLLWAFFRHFFGRMLKITMRLYAALKPRSILEIDFPNKTYTDSRPCQISCPVEINYLYRGLEQVVRRNMWRLFYRASSVEANKITKKLIWY